MRRYCRAIVERTLRETDTPEEARRKAIWMPVLVACYILPPLGIMLEYDYLTRAAVIGHATNVVAVNIGVWFPLIRRSVPMKLVSVVLCLLALGVLVADITAAAAMSSFRRWSWAVLLMDMCLALNVPVGTQWCILGMVFAWSGVYSTENSFRLGLYDIERFSKPSAYSVCECAAPPCSHGPSGLAEILGVLAVVGGDFFVTRHFATGLRVEQSKMQASVKVAEQVAGSLAGFDLEAAEKVMKQVGEDLPPPLAGSFRLLLRNLGSYRPYLPQSCFEEGEASADGSGSEHEAGSAASSADSQGPASGSGDAARRNTERHPRDSIRPSATGSIRSDDSSPPARSPSSAVSRSGDDKDPLTPRHSPRAPQERRVTLLTCNRTGFLAASRSASVGAWLAEMVERFASAVNGQGGVTDIICGDHFTASFGAVKAQGTHRVSATRAGGLFTAPGSQASELRELPRTGSVCSGRALCGDFGSSACQRFMVIGGVSAFLPAAERAAAAWGIRTLIDSDVQRDAEQFWNTKLRKLVKFPKLGPKPIGLWEVLDDRLGAVACDEWMYELDKAQANPWEPYNAAIRVWCESDARAALTAISQALDDKGKPYASEVVAALHTVRELVQKGAPAPVGDFSATAFAGDAAPFSPRGDAFA